MSVFLLSNFSFIPWFSESSAKKRRFSFEIFCANDSSCLRIATCSTTEYVFGMLIVTCAMVNFIEVFALFVQGRIF